VHLGHFRVSTRNGVRHRGRMDPEEAERIITEREIANKKRIWEMFGLEYNGEDIRSEARADQNYTATIPPPPPPYVTADDIGEKGLWGLSSTPGRTPASAENAELPGNTPACPQRCHFQSRVPEMTDTCPLRRTETIRSSRGPPSYLLLERSGQLTELPSSESDPPLYPRRLDSISKRRNEQ